MFIKLLVINAGNYEEIVCDADEEEEEEEEREREREREREIHTVPEQRKFKSAGTSSLIFHPDRFSINS